MQVHRERDGIFERSKTELLQAYGPETDCFPSSCFLQILFFSELGDKKSTFVNLK